jgi:C-terminal binding protein
MQEKYRVIITDMIADDLEPEHEILGDVAEVIALDGHDEKELIGHVEEADALMVYHHLSITKVTIDRLTRCKLIVRCGVGYDNVDHARARQRGIAVANVPDYGTEEVADSAIGLTLSLTRGTHVANSRLRARQGEWAYEQVRPLARLRGRTFGIVGLGRIGAATAIRAKALGMDVAYFDPYKPHGYDKSLGIRHIESFEELVAQSFVLSLHCPLTEETRLLVDASVIEQMPAGSFLINTARGDVVDISAIPDAIACGQLAGAGIDVLPDEPPTEDNSLVAAWRNPDHPAHERVIINPHIAFYCEEGVREFRTKGAIACRRAVLGERIPNVVN